MTRLVGSFIIHCLRCFGAPSRYVAWVKDSITNSSVSIALNGSLVGYIQGKKGLRQETLFPLMGPDLHPS